MRKSNQILYSSLLCSGLLALSLALRANAADSKPDLKAGADAPSFQATTTDGKTVSFPADYKGKVVLLDFWATWCPPCRAEVPNIVSVYDKYHSQGFDVLGVSLDQAHSANKLSSFTQEHKMAWPQIYDGKFWQAALAEQYGIESIPRPILVDGSTGKILAQGMGARGPALAPAVEKALAAKK